MTTLELFILAVGLSMDTFAVGISIGLSNESTSDTRRLISKFKTPLIVGAYFGVFQAVMPLVGFFAATRFAGHVAAFSHWIAFVLLLLIGGKMIAGGFKKEEIKTSLAPRSMLLLSLATSIDAMATGVTFAFLEVSILPAVLLIAVVTFIISAAGVRVGSLFGEKFKGWAGFAGGIILILIGLRILLAELPVFL